MTDTTEHKFTTWAEDVKKFGATWELRNGLEETIAYLQIRADEALLIDPATCELHSFATYTLDPYGVRILPPEAQQGESHNWARRPESDIWVSFDDLPSETAEAIWDRIEREHAAEVIVDEDEGGDDAELSGEDEDEEDDAEDEEDEEDEGEKS